MSQNRETKIILCSYNKGGVGKATLTVHITGVLCRQTSGKILMVDCDPRPDSWSFYKRRKPQGQERKIILYFFPTHAVFY